MYTKPITLLIRKCGLQNISRCVRKRCVFLTLLLVCLCVITFTNTLETNLTWSTLTRITDLTFQRTQSLLSANIATAKQATKEKPVRGLKGLTESDKSHSGVYNTSAEPYVTYSEKDQDYDTKKAKTSPLGINGERLYMGRIHYEEKDGVISKARSEDMPIPRRWTTTGHRTIKRIPYTALELRSITARKRRPSRGRYIKTDIQYSTSNTLVPLILRSENLDLMKQGPFKFIPNIKNPCWYEGKYMFCLPYFYLLGYPKCGTTDLYRKISVHPMFLKPTHKEPHWITRNRFSKQVSPFVKYLKVFAHAASMLKLRYEANKDNTTISTAITGDLSASTAWDNDQWRRLPGNMPERFNEPNLTNVDYVLHMNPNVKVIFIIRDPVDRLYSDYLFFTKKNKSTTDFHNKVLQALQIYQQCILERSPRSCAYDKKLTRRGDCRLRIGMYYIYANEWLKKMERKNALFLRLEDHGERPDESMQTIFRFLGLAPQNHTIQQAAEKKIANTRRKSDISIGPMLPETRKLLQDFYQPFNKKLADLLKDKRFNYGA